MIAGCGTPSSLGAVRPGISVSFYGTGGTEATTFPLCDETFARIGIRAWNATDRPSTKQLRLELCVLLDLYSRRAVGWAHRKSLSREVAVAALQHALTCRRPPAGLAIPSVQQARKPRNQRGAAAYGAFVVMTIELLVSEPDAAFSVIVPGAFEARTMASAFPLKAALELPW